MRKSTFKRRLFLAVAAASFLFRNWTIRKKLYLGFVSLIVVLTLNVVLTSYEISRLDIGQSKLHYLVYLDAVGVITGCLFIWIISQSVLRPMKRIIKQLESKESVDSLQHFYNDELGQLARAVNFMKNTKQFLTESTDEKKLLLEAILHASQERIFVFDKQGKLTSASRGFKSITGITLEEIEKMELSQYIFNLNLSQAVAHLASSNQKEHFYHQRVVYQSKQGKKVGIECSICKVAGIDQDMYIGILKEINRTQRMKDTFKKSISPILKFSHKKSKIK